jgi:hypothetical protein
LIGSIAGRVATMGNVTLKHGKRLIDEVIGYCDDLLLSGMPTRESFSAYHYTT